MNIKLNQNEIDSFNSFRKFYNEYLNEKLGEEMAFKKASENYFGKYGYYPYHNFEEYLTNLFSNQNGFQILKKSIY